MVGRYGSVLPTVPKQTSYIFRCVKLALAISSASPLTGWALFSQVEAKTNCHPMIHGARFGPCKQKRANCAGNSNCSLPPGREFSPPREVWSSADRTKGIFMRSMGGAVNRFGISRQAARLAQIPAHL